MPDGELDEPRGEQAGELTRAGDREWVEGTVNYKGRGKGDEGRELAQPGAQIVIP